MLVATGAAIAFLSICQRQKTLEKLSEWEFHLRDARRVLSFTDSPDLLTTRVPSLEIVPASREPDLAALAAGSDEKAFADGLRDRGFGGVIVEAQAGARPPAVLYRLARFSPGPHLEALALRPEAGLFAPGDAPEIADDALAYLVSAARTSLSGGSVAIPDPRAPRGVDREDPAGWEVALQIQGLAPKKVGTSRANLIRKDLFAPGVGPTLVEATIAAARRISELYEKDHAGSEGPLREAIGRLRIELHVLHGFAHVLHERSGASGAAYSTFLNRVVQPGLYGLALGWTPPRGGRALGRIGFHVRLPADPVYWSRTSGRRALERLLMDGRLGKIDRFEKNALVTLDRFESIHVIESGPGGRPIRLERGIAAHPPPEEARSLATRITSRIARDMSPDGLLLDGYDPVRDLVGGRTDPSAPDEAERQGLGILALHAAGSDRPAEDRAFARMLGWVRICPPVDVAALPPPLDGLDPSQAIPFCGPVDTTGRPAAVAGWAPSGASPAPVPEGLAFVVHGPDARLGATALLLVSIVDRLDPKMSRKDRKSIDPVLRGLVDFILLLQRADGTFESHFVVPGHELSDAQEPHSAGLALLALAAARPHVEDERIGPAIEKGISAQLREMERAGTDCARLAAIAPWTALAASRARLDALAGTRLLVSRCLVTPDRALAPDLAGGYVDGAIPGASDVLAAAGVAASLGIAGPSEKPTFKLAVDLGLELASRLVVTRGVNDHIPAVPAKAMDGVGHDLLDHTQSIDHAFAVVALLTQLSN